MDCEGRRDEDALLETKAEEEEEEAQRREGSGL